MVDFSGGFLVDAASRGARLVRVIDVRSSEELEAFCAAAHPRLVAALGHHVGDRWLAEELAQEALVRAVERWPTVRSMDSPLGWTFRVGVNLASSHFRRRGAEHRARERAGAASDEHQDPEPADRLVVLEALAALSDRQRAVILARYFLGLTTQETATSLGSTPDAVRAMTHRAVVALRRTLDVRVKSEEAIDVT